MMMMMPMISEGQLAVFGICWAIGTWCFVMGHELTGVSARNAFLLYFLAAAFTGWVTGPGDATNNVLVFLVAVAPTLFYPYIVREQVKSAFHSEYGFEEPYA